LGLFKDKSKTRPVFSPKGGEIMKKAFLHAFACAIGVIALVVFTLAWRHGTVALLGMAISGSFAIQNLVLAALAANNEE
jgi:hypothetical protein